MLSPIAMKIPNIMVLVLPLCLLVCVSLESLFAEAKKLACGFPGTPAYGYVKPDNAGYNEGAVVSYSCRVGYILLGSPISRCTSDGSWSEDVPICDDSMTTLGVAFSTPTVPGHPAELAIDRNRDTCTYLKPKKPRWWRIDLGEEHKVLSVAVTIISIDKDVKFTVFIIKTEGTTASYNRCGSFSGKFGTQTVLLSCAEGKGIEGEKVHIEDHYQLEGFFEICEVEVQVEKDSGYDCGRPNRNLYSITSESKNDIVEYECMRGYTLVGNDFRTCLNSGEWSGEPPICEPILCDDLEELENGDISLSHSNYGPPLEGALVIYQCHEGYKLEGGFTRSCLRDGSWSGKAPRCKVIRCPIPDGKDVGGIYRLVNLTNSMGSLAMLRCKGGKREGDNPYIKCTEEGEWTKPEAHCTLPALAAFDRKTASYINNQGGIIFGMVVAAVMIVVVLVAIYLYGEKRLSWNGPKPEIPSRSAQPSVPPPRPPPRASKGGSFKTAMMGLMNRDSTDTRNAWKNQSLPSYSDDDDESNQYGPKRVTSFEDSLPDDVAIIQVEVLPHHGLAKGRYPPVLEENEDTSLDNVALDIEEGESSPPEQMSGNENDGYEANRRTRLSKERDSGESSSTAGASPLPPDESDAKESSAQQEGSSEEEESEEEEEESQKESKNEIERRLREEEEKRQEEERKAEEERIANEEKERLAKEEEEKLKKEKPSEVPRRRRLRDDPSPTVEDKPVLRRFRK